MQRQGRPHPLARILLSMRGMTCRRATAATLAVALLALAAAAFAAPPEWLAHLYNKDRQAVLMRFKPVPDATEYKVYRSMTTGDNYELLGTSKAPNFIDETPEPAETYFWVFTAVTPSGETERSEPKTMLIPGTRRAKPLGPPTWAKTAASTQTMLGKSESTVSLSWSHARAAEATGFNVYRAEKEGDEGTIVASLGQTDFAYADKKVEAEKTYYYSLSAMDANLEETPRSEVKAITVPKAEVVKKKVAKLRKPIPKTTEIVWQTYNDSEKTQQFPSRADLRELVDLAYNPKTDRLYVTVTTPRIVTVLNAADGKNVKTIGPKIGDKEFGLPMGIAAGPDGNLYMTDQKLSAVFVFNDNGDLVRYFEVPKGKNDEKPVKLLGIAVLKDGRIAVVDNANSHVVIFDATGKELDRWGKKGFEQEDQLNAIGPVKETTDGNLAIGDAGSGMIKILTPAGEFKLAFGEPKPTVEGFQFIAGLIALDNGHFLVSDVGPHLIKEFDPNGDPRQYLADLSNHDGTGRCDIVAPVNMATNGKGVIYVAEGMVNRVSAHKLGQIIEEQKK